MLPRFATILPKQLVGHRLTMSFAENRTGELWRGFMPRRKEIKNNVDSNLYSVQIYAPGYFENFNPVNTFEKWAAIEVKDFDDVPEGMEIIILPGGLYAVFDYKGRSSEGAAAYNYIFAQWLPASGYVLDNRPHFEILGAKYKNDAPDSEEEILIPVKEK